MSSVNISIREEAYEFLSRLKTKDKSFSDIILGFREKNKGPMEFFGALKEIDWDEKENRMKNLKQSFGRRLR